MTNEFRTVAREQAAVARLGQLALSDASLTLVLKEATTVVAQELHVEYTKVLELLPGGEALLLRAGAGWKRGYVGRAKVPAKANSQAGYTLLSRHPVVTEDLRKEKRFTTPSLLSKHNVVSGISTIILGRKGPYGILGAHSSRRRIYKSDDINFMRVVANVLAAAIERKSAERVARSHTRVLLRTLNALTTAPDLSKFLDEVLVAITDQLKVHSCALWLHDFDNKTNTLYKTSHSGKVLMGKQQLNHPSAAGDAHFKRKVAVKALGRRPFVIRNVPATRLLEPEVRAWMKTHRVKLMLCVPLLFGRRVIGTLTVRDTIRDRFSKEEIVLAQALARYVSLALQLIRLAEEGQHSTLLQERNRVAREIHDTLGQGFTGILIQLEAAEDVLGENHQEARVHLKKARDLARESLAEARRSVWALHPRALEGGDLTSALRNLAHQMTAGKQIKVDFLTRGKVRPLSPEKEVHLLRIGQEALTNALRHAQASRIKVELAFNRRGVQLSVKDNGHGFDVTSGSKDGGFGQFSLRERAEQIGAKIMVDSEPGSGTRVVAIVPATSPSAGVSY